MLRKLGIAAVFGPIIAYLTFNAYHSLLVAGRFVINGYPGWTSPALYIVMAIAAFAYVVWEQEQ